MGLSANYDLILGVGFLAYTIVALTFASAGLREGGLLCPATPKGSVYRAHPYGRVFAAMLGFLFTVGAPLLYGAEALNWKRSPVSMPSSDWFPFALLICMNIAMGGLTFWLAGPNDFFTDLDRRSYRHAYGWAFHRKEITGMLDDDIAGVFVRCGSMNSRYDVGRVWKRERQWKRFVMCSRSGRADRCVEETAAALGLPLVAPPPYLKSSSDIRNGLG